ncbi:MAG TPA: ATPase, T2SS/T4P/T4SS family [Candidatus Saccharimonadales bacterium]|nr:ATPase, T2SS/T4P/T4SS family [Candidatus Saccharimonadales bacterium]
MDGKESLLGRLMGNAEKFTRKQVAQTVQLLLEHGARWQASDIHIEPHEQYVLVRYRIDGHLRSAHKIPRKALPALLEQCKEMALLDPKEVLAPQQGNFQTTVKDTSYTVQITTMPVYGGEKLVLHLTAQAKAPVPLAALGYWGKNLESMQTALARSFGTIIVTAPKHHGRPTTQASMVAALNNPALSIATIEEHLSYRIPHANQTAVNPRSGLSMLKGLQAVLHQDPNVVVVGSITDKDVADLTIETGMSGHLVVAGMHSDSAVSSLLHLRALGVPDYLMASSIKIVCAQRLVRKLCEHCRMRTAITESQLEQLKKSFNISGPAAFKRIHELEIEAIESGIGEDKRPSTSSKTITHLWRPNREGCEACGHTGYNGRTALTEVLTFSDRVHKALLDPKTTSASLQASLIKNEGFVPLALDGITKSLRGHVAMHDVLRVTHTA